MSSVTVVADLTPVLAMVDSGELDAVGIDMPVGLPDHDPRSCDLGARRMLGPRASSVFPAPMRSVLGSKTYEEACARSVAACGKAISRQGFGILSRIGSVDRVMTPARQDALFEVHPELSFAVMVGRPMIHRKRSREGGAERLAALRRELSGTDRHLLTRVPGARSDDVLDAAAVAWSARRRLAGTHVQLGGDLDARGIRMEIVA